MRSSRKNGGASSTGASSSATTHKRKRKPGEARYYAVRAGRIPGVYTTWDECQSMINGFSGAQYKSFPTVEEAMLFAEGKNPNPGSKPNRFYAVAVGNKPGIYTEWHEAQAAYKGVKAPKYKKFDTRQAAQEWLKTFEHTQSTFTITDGEEVDEDDEEETSRAAKRRKADEAQFALASELNEFAGDPQVQQIWTDGSSLSNGQKGAVAGVGVFFGDHDPRNLSERLPGEVQTNQRAELTAILRAMQVVPASQSILIWSDSQYAINCVNEWSKKWEQNGWMTHKGEVQNKDLVQAILAEKRKREAVGGETEILWVKGHSKSVENSRADELAVTGATKAKKCR